MLKRRLHSVLGVGSILSLGLCACGAEMLPAANAPETTPPKPHVRATRLAPEVQLLGPSQPGLQRAPFKTDVIYPEPGPPATLGPCEVPSALPADPMSIVQEHPLFQDEFFPVHMLDIDATPEGRTVYVLGMGGLFVLQRGAGGYHTVNNTLDLWLGDGETEVRSAQFSELETLDAGWLAMSNRDFGLSFVNASTPSAPVVAKSITLPNASGLHHHGSYLTVVTHSGELVNYDISNPADPRELGRLTGLGNPWDVHVLGNYAYVADNTLGLAVVDISLLAQPRLLGAVATAGGAQDVEADAQALYVAVGGAGLEVFDLRDPAQPAPVARLDYGTAVVSVSVSQGRLWAATHEDVFVVDVRLPNQPRPIARQRTEQFAMAVLAVGDTGYVADWGQFVQMSLDTSASAPAADPERTEIVFLEQPDASGAPQVVALPIRNRGNQALHISGASVSDARFDYAFQATTIPAAGESKATITFYNDGAEIDAELCIATDDPDQPLWRIALRSAPSARTSAGEFAPDFVLPTIESDNETYRLSEQLGHPVVLVYFAMW